MNRWTVLLAAMLLVGLVALGCSGNGNPVAPGSDLTPGAQTIKSNSNTYLWGYYDVTIDPATKSVVAVPDRTTQFCANVVTFLNSNPAAMTFNMVFLEIGAEKVVVDIDVTLSHPFDGMPQFNGYDVRGAFVGNGSSTMKYNNKCKVAKYGTDQYMMDDPVNADGGGPDGYTRWFNAVEFTDTGLLGYTRGNFATKNYNPTATVNPYKYFADGIEVGDDPFDFLMANAAENGVFASGSSNTRNYYLEFPLPTPAASYGYSIIANWEAPDIHPSNAVESVALSVAIDPDVYYFDGTDNGGDIILDIDVWGWNYQPSAMFVESNVLTALYTFDATDMTPVGGGENYSTYHVEIPTDNVTYNSSTGGDSEFWVICRYDEFDYTSPFPGAAPTADLASFFRYPLYVHYEAYCTDPTVTSMNPNKGTIKGSVNDCQILGSNMEAGAALACWLTNGTLNINGTDVKWVSATQCTADFNYIGAGATEGFYDLHFVDGDGCEVVLEDAMELKDLYKETFNSSPANWTYAYYQYWSGCSNGTVGFSTNSPFGPSGSGNIRYPGASNYTSGGDLQTVVSPPFAIPTGMTNLHLRIYACENFGGSWSGYMNSNFKIVASSTPGLAPFVSGNPAPLPAGGAYLQNNLGYGSGGWGQYTSGCYTGPLNGQPGWYGSHGGGAFPGTLTQWLDLTIPATYFGQTVKVAFQWHPDWCGYTGGNTGFAMDDWELWAP